MTTHAKRSTDADTVNTDLAHRARLTLAEQSRDSDECRELGLMLGLFELDGQDGGVKPSNPWIVNADDARMLSPRG